MEMNLTWILAAAALLAVFVLGVRSRRRGEPHAAVPGGSPQPAEAYRDLVHRLAPKHRATSDAFLGVEVEIMGERLHCECLTLDDGFYWAQVLAAARAGNALAQLRMGDFPAAIAPEGREDLFQLLQPREAYALADRFLAHERPGVLKGIDPAAATKKKKIPTPTNSTGASTT